MPLLRLIVASLLFCALHAGAAQRLALVIGNEAYRNAPLDNPVNDARAMAGALRATGFEVTLLTNADLQQTLAALRDFGDRLKEGGGAGLFYFAGHGMQIRGRNFLLPVSAKFAREDEVAYESLDAQAVLDKMESAGNGTNLVILDACRNNPFARSTRGVPQGLAQMDAPVGTLIAFSTAPGTVASDGDGANGLYTRHLLGGIGTPGLKLEDLFKQVRAAVRRESQGRQVPWESTSLEGDFYFVPPPPPAPAPDPLALVDDTLWDTVKDSDQPGVLQLYLRRLPAGRHAAEAQRRLEALATPAPATAPPATEPAPPPAAEPAPLALAPAEGGRADRAIEESSRRINEILRWGDEGTDRRPPKPARNGAGFTQGDRYRWLLTDRRRNESIGMLFWRIDRVDADGSLGVNEGAVQLDPVGDLRMANDLRRGTWERWDLPVPIGAAARAGQRMPFETRREMRDAQGVVSRMRLSGTLKPGGREVLVLQAGRLDTQRFELSADGAIERDNGTRGYVSWRQTIWFSPGLALPVAWELDERIDGRLERQLRQELVAYDVAPVP